MEYKRFRAWHLLTRTEIEILAPSYDDAWRILKRRGLENYHDKPYLWLHKRSTRRHWDVA